MRFLNTRKILIALLTVVVALPAFAENPDDHGRGRPAPAPAYGPSRGPVRSYPAPTPVYGPSRGPVRSYPAPTPVYGPSRGPVRSYPAPIPVYGPSRGYPVPGYGVRIIESRGEIRYENDRRFYRPIYPVIYRAPVRTYYRDPSYDYDRGIYDLINRGSVQRLGSTYLAESNDYEVIPVQECGIRQIQIRIRNNDVNIDHIVAVYENGTSQQLDVNEYYQEGSFSAWKELPYYNTCVREVIVVGATINFAFVYRQQAEVEIYGLK